MTTISARPTGDHSSSEAATMPAAVPPRLNPVRRGPVLLALNGREAAHAPIIFGRLLAERLKVDLRVVTVVQPLLNYGAEWGIGIAPAAPMYDPTAIQEENVKRMLREVVGDEKVVFEARYGRPAREISRLAEEVDATFIIVAAAPHRGLRHHGAGVRALQVLRQAPCPVLSVSSDAVALPKTVVAAVDFSPASMRAAQAAMLLLDEGGTLIVAHVPSPMQMTYPLQDATGALYGGNVDDALDRACAELLSYAPPRVTIEKRSLEGPVVETLLGLAESVNAALVAVGSHGLNIAERLFVGSVTANILHAAQCSVLASPAPPPAESVRLKLRMTDTAVTDKPSEWAEVLAAVSRRNAGRVVTLEVDDPAIGAQVQATGYRLRGIDYDPADRRVDIMLGDGSGKAGHLTRTIEGVKAVAINSSPGGQDRAIEIKHGSGHTVVLFQL